MHPPLVLLSVQLYVTTVVMADTAVNPPYFVDNIILSSCTPLQNSLYFALYVLPVYNGSRCVVALHFPKSEWEMA